MDYIKDQIKKGARILEIAISVLVIVGVLIGLLEFPEYFTLIGKANTLDTYEVFQRFLGYALLLIVGVELVLMILYHSTQAILELILFVISRKMLIHASTMFEVFLGTLSIGIIFLIVLIMRFMKQGRKKDLNIKE
ncbi:hypothetical protein [Aerococcus christensenii]|uniref:hypothetical protein n=1 Tax=Aerococcus christensenii TaxID=87541 RepID=UPI000763270F|nr:hypothetical protein [Aerococcus christensenii]AMB93120.1 hypothetical protein AWM71_07500 [Aerococcus christensenii]